MCILGISCCGLHAYHRTTCPRCNVRTNASVAVAACVRAARTESGGHSGRVAPAGRFVSVGYPPAFDTAEGSNVRIGAVVLLLRSLQGANEHDALAMV